MASRICACGRDITGPKQRRACYVCRPARYKAECAGKCGALVWIQSTSLPEGQSVCHACRAAAKGYTGKIEVRECPHCENLFEAKQYRPVGKPARYPVFCSQKCSNAYRSVGGEAVRYAIKSAKRRSLLAAQVVETVDPEKVFERDNWTCQLCFEPVDKLIPRYESKGATLDHIIPLSKGGAHSYANTQLAHFGCNSSKSDQVLGNAS